MVVPHIEKFGVTKIKINFIRRLTISAGIKEIWNSKSTLRGWRAECDADELSISAVTSKTLLLLLVFLNSQKQGKQTERIQIPSYKCLIIEICLNEVKVALEVRGADVTLSTAKLVRSHGARVETLTQRKKSAKSSVFLSMSHSVDFGKRTNRLRIYESEPLWNWNSTYCQLGRKQSGVNEGDFQSSNRFYSNIFLSDDNIYNSLQCQLGFCVCLNK